MNNEWIQMAMAPTPAKSGAEGGAADPAAGLISLLPIVLIFVLFYVLFILPQRKQAKKHEQLLQTLKKGDEIKTSGGMYASISGFNEKANTVYLKIADNVKIEVDRSSIAGLRQQQEVQK